MTQFMKAILDHIGIAVGNVPAALAFYRDALGLEIEAPEDVASQHVRAHFVRVGESKLELLEATAPDSAIASYIEKRGPGLHHITLRVENIKAALAQLESRGVRMIDETPRPGAEGSTIAFVHPSATNGVLIELKQAGLAVRPIRSAQGRQSHHEQLSEAPLILSPSPRDWARGDPEALEGPKGERDDRIRRFSLGDIELISVCDGFFHLDGGSMFGTVPRTLWASHAPPDEHHRITLAMRPLIVRGARTMIIDAGLGDKESATFCERYGVDRARNLDHTLAEAGIAPEDIDIVLASHLHFDHAGGFTTRDASGRLRPRFPRAQYVVRRGEWEDAAHPHERNRSTYLADNYVPLAEAGVLQLVDDDQAIMPGVRVRRTGGHTMHHQMAVIESGGKTAAFVADIMPTRAHAPNIWIMGYDLYPMDTLAAKKAFAKEALEREILIFFGHDPVVPAGYLREQDGKRRVVPAVS